MSKENFTQNIWQYKLLKVNLSVFVQFRDVISCIIFFFKLMINKTWSYCIVVKERKNEDYLLCNIYSYKI